MIVVDASALVDVLLDRPVRSAVVDHFATGLCAPAHQPAEALSAIARVVRAGLISAEDGRSALLELTLLDQEHVAPSAEHLRRAIELQDRVRVLDGLYVALAEQRRCPLLTTDTRLAASDPPCEVILVTAGDTER